MAYYKACLLNGIILLAIGFWGYAANHFNAHTGIIPIGFGLLLILLSKFFQQKKNGLYYVILILTTIVMLALFRPLMRNIEQSDWYGISRLSLEIASCAMAIIIYLRNPISLIPKSVDE